MIYIYAPKSSLGVFRSASILDQYLSSYIETKLVFTILSVFIRIIFSKLFGRKDCYILSLKSILLAPLAPNPVMMIHGAPDPEHYKKIDKLSVELAYIYGFIFTKIQFFVSYETMRAYQSYVKTGCVFHNVSKEFSYEDIVAKTKLIYWGRVIPAKGVDDIIKIFRSLRNTSSDWTLDIWGDGPSSYVDTLTEVGGVNYFGKFNDVQCIKNKYGDMNGFVFISLNKNEPFGITYIEAAECKCVVVCPPRAGASEVLSGSAFVSYYSTTVVPDICKIFGMTSVINCKVNDDREKIRVLLSEFN